MKNLKKRIFQITALTVTMLFMSASVFAQIQESQKNTTSQDTTMQSTDQLQTTPQEQNQRTNQGIDTKDSDKGVDYSETIEKSELPQEINSSLDELYPAHEVSEVFKGDDDSFKVKVKNADDEAIVYYSSEGKFLRAENLSGLQQEGELPQEQGQRTQGTQNQDQWGTDDDRTNQGTQQSELGTGTNTRTGQQGTQEGTWGTQSDSDEIETQQGTYQKDQQDSKKRNTDTDNRSTQDETQQDAWGTESSTRTNEGSAYPQEQNQRSDDTFGSQDSDKGVDYSETVEESDLPEGITTSLDELYPSHEISEIQKGDDDSYKVTVKNKDDEAIVYYSSEGEFLRAKSLDDMLQGAFPQEQGQKIKDSKVQGAMGTHSHSDHHKSEMETDSDNTSDQQGTQGTWGTGTDKSGTQQDQMGTSTDENEDNWGTESQGAHQSTWENDSLESSDRPNEGSAFPQEQNQRTDDQELGSQGERQLDKEWGANDPAGTRSDRTGSQDDQSDNQFGVSKADTTKARDYGTTQDRSKESDYTSPQEQSQMTSDEDYTEEVQENDLPEAVTTSLEELYPEHDVDKAYKGSDGSYKVKVKNQDDVVAVYYDSDGSFLRDEKKDSTKDKENKDTNQDW